MESHKNSGHTTVPLSIVRTMVIILVFAMVVIIGLLVWLQQQGGALAFGLPTQPGDNLLSSGSLTPSATPSATSPVVPIATNPFQANLEAAPIYFAPFNQGLILLAIAEGGSSHLFAYQEASSFLRLTNGPWHDIHPEISPDGRKVAFASNRDGQWDLYIMDLFNGEITRLTDTRTYDGSPSWSPDGRWMVYESYVENDPVNGPNLELFIRPIDGSEVPIRLTFNSEADYSPRWSPQGRIVAYISTNGPDRDVWLADLDKIDERFQNISHNQNSAESHPAWSSDGTMLSWSSTDLDGIQHMYTWNYSNPQDRPRQLNNGDWSAWSPSGDSLLVTLQTPNQVYLSGYSLYDRKLSLPALALNGQVLGVTWGATSLPSPLPEVYQRAVLETPTPNWEPTLTPGADVPGSRQRLVVLPEMEDQELLLQDRADDSFNALRQRVAAEVGWDFLSNLEAAFVPLTAPLEPGVHEDWLTTGRAFSFNTAPVSASWVMIMREDYGPQTYWRVFLRARFQDGSQGEPLKSYPWDFSARYSGDPMAYENGGAPMAAIPSGYWLDFTSLAAAYGWERLPALPSWRLAFSSTQFNKFALTEGQDWMTAMLEIYPRTALDTYTPVPSPSDTPTITMTPTNTYTPTRKPWYSRTPTLTRTPWPTRTPTPTRTPRVTLTPTRTLRPSRTPSPTPMPSYTPRPY